MNNEARSKESSIVSFVFLASVIKIENERDVLQIPPWILSQKDDNVHLFSFSEKL